MLQDSEEACAVWAAAKLASARVPLQQVHGWRVEYKLRGVDSGNGGRTGDMYCFPPEQLLPHEGEAGLGAAGLGAAGQGSRRVVRSLTAHRSPLTFHPHPNPHPNPHLNPRPNPRPNPHLTPPPHPNQVRSLSALVDVLLLRLEPPRLPWLC